MDRVSTAIIPTSRTELPDTRLRGRQKALARTVWVTLFGLNVVWFGLAVVAQIASSQHPCATTCPFTLAQAELFRHLGIGLGTVAAYYIGLPALSVVASLILAALLFWRRSDDWLALAVGLFLVYRVGSFAFGAYSVNIVAVAALIALLQIVDSIAFYGVLLIFPDGRFVPHWVWLLLVTWAGQQVVTDIVVQGGITPPAWFTDIVSAAYPVLYLSALAVQVYRFRRVSNARQRQQTKWVILGFAVALSANILYWIVLPLTVPPFLTPASLHIVTLLYPVIAFPLYQVVTVALPVSFFIAIQRHQLFDVDVLVKRTLVYSSLTLLLAAVYFGSVIALQQFVRAVTGQGQTAPQSPLVIVLSTLLIAALFTPLRRGLQSAIDRAFYRRKYDAAHTLERFAATLRSEVDLSALREHLVAVVQETMQPAAVSLWLPEPGKSPKNDRPIGGD